MARSGRFGLMLALFGALVLTPDALFLRWSGMTGLQMLGWRGLCLGALFIGGWALTSKAHRRDLAALGSRAGIVVLVGQFFNAMLFPVGIANAPVAPVLLGVATVPVWSALLSRLWQGEVTSRGTWVVIALVLAGLVLSVSDPAHSGGLGSALVGALCGLGVALALAVNFVTLRFHAELPLPLVLGLGAFAAGLTGWWVTGTARMADGQLWAILVTALLILPLAFFALNLAARHTAAANVSLLLLLETVLGPLWVWVGIGEAPGPRALLGGALVVITLAIYIARRARRA